MDKNKILIVDDDALTCELLSILLGKKGYDVAIATNGKEAILWQILVQIWSFWIS